MLLWGPQGLLPRADGCKAFPSARSASLAVVTWPEGPRSLARSREEGVGDLEIARMPHGAGLGPGSPHADQAEIQRAKDLWSIVSILIGLGKWAEANAPRNQRNTVAQSATTALCLRLCLPLPGFIVFAARRDYPDV